MKRFFVIFVGLFLLSGCSNVDAQNTKIYHSTVGDVLVPIDPQRIVTDYYVGQLLSIDANVVGGDLTYKSPAWGSSVDSVTDIGQSTEMVASLAPDLIITFNEEAYNQYQSIAPTVLIPYGTYNEEEIITELGIVTSNEREAQEVTEKYNQKIEELLLLVDDPNKTYSIMEFLAADPYAYGNNFGRLGYVIFDKLNLKGTPKAEETILKSKESYILLTQETLSEYVGDVLILSTVDAKPTDNAFTKSQGYLDATKDSQIYYVDSNLFYHTDMLSIFEQMDVLKEILSGQL